MGPEKRAIRNLAKHMRERRLALGWSQEELAERMGTDRTYISDLERSLRNPSLKILARLASTLDTTVGDLCD
jgi:transcriptional regulator with XRE-family HTH domain